MATCYALADGFAQRTQRSGDRKEIYRVAKKKE
jgi:hypothetical protein